MITKSIRTPIKVKRSSPKVVIPLIKITRSRTKTNIQATYKNTVTTKNRINLNYKLKPQLQVKKSPQRHLPVWIKRMTKFESYISSKQLMAASVKTQTAKQYRSSGEKFYKYVEHIRVEFPSLPLIKDILTNFDIFQLDTLIYEFLTKKI